jgi:predicted metal-dependent HD superfamily phosphohydrolase
MDLDRWWPDVLACDTQIRDRLIAAYGQGRGYHDLQHLSEVLEHLDELMPAEYADRDAVLLAAWFHDAVYESPASAGETNEERSALMAERELATIDAPPRLVDEVARLVRLTETHRPAEDDLNGQLLCDADLAILAAGPERYAEYVTGVRSEYAEVPDPDFRAGRRAILEDLLDKPTLFHCPAAQRMWEQPARANLLRELSA